MKAKTKFLIVASACLLALSLGACGNESEREDQTAPAGETVTSGAVEATPSDADDTAADDPVDSRPAADSQDPDSTAPDEPAESETVGKIEDTNEVVGPVPPAPETEPPTETPTEPTMPDFGEIGTNEDGVIELPFVPFPTD